MSGQIVEDHDSSGIELRGQLCLDICVESGSIHRAVDHPRCDQGVLGQTGNERLRAPFAEWSRTIKPLTDSGTSAQPREVRLDSGFVDEDQPMWLLAHVGLAARDPVSTGLTQRGPITFRCDQSFFYMKARRVRGRDAAKRVAPPRHGSRPAQRPVP